MKKMKDGVKEAVKKVGGSKDSDKKKKKDKNYDAIIGRDTQMFAIHNSNSSSPLDSSDA